MVTKEDMMLPIKVKVKMRIFFSVVEINKGKS